MSDDAKRPPDWRIWLNLRWQVIRHPRQLRSELDELTCGVPWYAAARPFALIQHWAPDLLMPITYCGRWAGQRSSGEIRTAFGWHCRKCHRRAKRALIERKARAGSANETAAEAS